MTIDRLVPPRLKACFRRKGRLSCTSATVALYGGMVTMFRGPRWKIAVYGRDHGVPHFHIEGPDFRCSVAIATFELIVGTVPTAVLKDALEWAGPNQALLMQTWQELNG
ncbi:MULTISPECIES: DUF4160 domain-containing protein [Sphingomonadaceae]|nr:MULTISPECIES: DUF4160 domain-containing protein [Sphingomonadaceae]MCM3681561.1 DUF4160 domain-containing protein [Sphingomonas paucimobilis]